MDSRLDCRDRPGLIVDQRWIGPHGIGRFAAEVLSRTGGKQVPDITRPSNPVDPLYLSIWLFGRRGVFFSPGYNSPLYCRQPFIFTIHDLNHIDRPENTSVLKKLYYRIVIKRACRRALLVLTVSEFSRERILQWSGVSPEKVVNVGNGVAASYTPEGERYEPGFAYLLCVSNRKKHKNEPMLVRAFAAADIDPRVHLLLTGEPTAELLKLAEELGCADRLGFLGTVDEDAMPALYRGATALAFPSLYEGFGLPALEAMACGTPVIASNTTAFPAVCGDAALLVSPESLQSISGAIERIVRDSSLQERLRACGPERAKLFSWDRTGALVLEALARARSCRSELTMEDPV